MRRLTLQLLIAMLTFVVGVIVSALWLTHRTHPEVRNKTELGVKAAGNIEKRVDFEGISFNYDSALFADVKAEIVPASPLTDVTHKPDYVAPRHVRFTFPGSYASKHKLASFTGEIRLYPIEGYRQAYSISKDDVEGLDEEFKKLRILLSLQSVASWKGEIPYLLYADATQEFRAHVKHVDFQNGKGVAFLTQYNVEPSLVNNQRLTYIFQGLTEDNKYYVVAIFPVAASMLPDEDGVGSHGSYTIEDLYRPNRRASQKAYESYLTKAVRELEGLPPEKYEPNLRLLEKLVRSIRVQGKVNKQLP